MHFIYCDQYKFAIVWHSLVVHSVRVRCPISNTITIFVWCLSLVAYISCCYGVFETFFLWIELSALHSPTRQLARTLSSRWFYDFIQSTSVPNDVFRQFVGKNVQNGALLQLRDLCISILQFGRQLRHSFANRRTHSHTHSGWIVQWKHATNICMI